MLERGECLYVPQAFSKMYHLLDSRDDGIRDSTLLVSTSSFVTFAIASKYSKKKIKNICPSPGWVLIILTTFFPAPVSLKHYQIEINFLNI